VLGLRQFEAVRGRVAGAFAMRATALLVAHPEFTVPSSAATTRSIWRAGHGRRQPPVLADFPLTGSICSPARSTATPLPPILSISWCGDCALAGARGGSGAIEAAGQRAAEGSPQAMNAGTIKSFPSFPNSGRRLARP